jgi:hypothetical protein
MMLNRVLHVSAHGNEGINQSEYQSDYHENDDDIYQR